MTELLVNIILGGLISCAFCCSFYYAFMCSNNINKYRIKISPLKPLINKRKHIENKDNFIC